jgi:hypothetical protein
MDKVAGFILANSSDLSSVVDLVHMALADFEKDHSSRREYIVRTLQLLQHCFCYRSESVVTLMRGNLSLFQELARNEGQLGSDGKLISSVGSD